MLLLRITSLLFQRKLLTIAICAVMNCSGLRTLAYLCDRPYRPHYGRVLSVRLSFRLSVCLFARVFISRTKGVEKLKSTYIHTGTE